MCGAALAHVPGRHDPRLLLILEPALAVPDADHRLETVRPKLAWGGRMESTA